MYMNTRANLEYWSTDNCCLRWSLRTGSITIGLLSLVWQSLMVMSGVMMLVRCPVTIDPQNITTITNTTNHTPTGDSFTTDLVVVDTGEDVVVAASNLDEQVIEDTDEGVKCPGSGRGGYSDKKGPDSAYAGVVENNTSLSNANTTSIDDQTSNNTFDNETRQYIICPWLPDPEIEVLGVYNQEKLALVAGIFVAYSGIYCILSLCVVVGSFTNSVALLQGWVAFTGFHNMLVLASLLVPLPFTTLLHLFLSIAYFILSLYTWAVVKSYMHALKVQLNKPLLPEGSITDYTVDGVDVTEIPVQV